jgi:hypothetical protein
MEIHSVKGAKRERKQGERGLFQREERRHFFLFQTKLIRKLSVLPGDEDAHPQIFFVKKKMNE